MQIKIFSSNSGNIEFLESKVNDWLATNSVKVSNISTSAHASNGGTQSFYHEDLYIIIVYEN